MPVLNIFPYRFWRSPPAMIPGFRDCGRLLYVIFIQYQITYESKQASDWHRVTADIWRISSAYNDIVRRIASPVDGM